MSKSARLRLLLAAAVACLTLVALGTTVPAASAKGTARATCADKLCKHYAPHVRGCKRIYVHRRGIARCFIRRAARHFHQSRSEAYYIAWRESRYHWKVTNPSSGTAGLYQFAHVTWRHTPYRHFSPYQPRWAALAAMWMWAHGYKSAWAV